MKPVEGVVDRGAHCSCGNTRPEIGKITVITIGSIVPVIHVFVGTSSRGGRLCFSITKAALSADSGSDSFPSILP